MVISFIVFLLALDRFGNRCFFNIEKLFNNFRERFFQGAGFAHGQQASPFAVPVNALRADAALDGIPVQDHNGLTVL